VSRGASGSATERPALTFSARDRLRKRFEFQLVREQARRVHTRSFVVLVAPPVRVLPGPEPRLGITVSRQVGQAVRRNRIKRLVRELFRTHRELFPERSDVVVIAKTGCQVDSLSELLGEFERARGALRAAARGPSVPAQRGAP
jgi:ribonuclease P protein component